MDRSADRQIKEYYRQEVEKALAKDVIEAGGHVIGAHPGTNSVQRPKKGKGSKKVH